MKINFKLLYPTDENKELLNLVYKLRYDVYVKEKKVPLENKEEILKDKYDDYFPSLLIFDENKPIGSIRIELSCLGKMEIEEANSNWENLLPKGNSISFTRFVLLKEYRGKNITPKIFKYLFSIGKAEKYDLKYAYFCANNPGLIKKYKLFAKVIDNRPNDYNFMGLKRENYFLFFTKIGPNKSLNRKINHFLFKIYPLLYIFL